MKVAVTDTLPLIDMVQVDFPVQVDHPAKTALVSGVATRVSSVPGR